MITPALVRGYLVLEDVQAGDVFEYTTPMKVVLHDTQDNADFVAFKYGPVVLSTALKSTPTTASTGTGILVRKSTFDSTAQTTITVAGGTTAAQWKAAVTENVVRIADSADGQVRFTLRNTSDAGHLVYTPHFMRYKETYGLYMNLEEPDSQASQDRLLQSKVQQRELEFGLDSLTTFDNNNFENAKNLRTNGSSSVGQFNGRTYRDASNNGSWFSYDLQIDPSVAKNYLQITYYGGDAGRPAFNILANETLLKSYSIRQSTPSNQFYLDTTELSGAVLTAPRYKKDALGNDVLDDNGNRIPIVNIRIQATGWIAGGIFGIRTARSLEWDTTAALGALAFDTGSLAPAFDPEATSYTLTVPTGTRTVDLDVDPHLPSGLVRVDGILIDDTVPRLISLPADGAVKTVTVTGYAQDHTTKKDYTVTIVQGGATDTTAPTTTASLTAGSPAIVTLTATDEENGSGVALTRYRVGSDAWTDYTAPISVPRTTSARVLEFRSTDVAGNEEQLRSIEIPAAPAADLTTATACLNGKAVLTVRARNTGTTATDLTFTTGVGTKVFVGLAPKGLAAHNFAAPGKELPAGQVTISSLSGTGGTAVNGTVVLPYSARTCS